MSHFDVNTSVDMKNMQMMAVRCSIVLTLALMGRVVTLSPSGFRGCRKTTDLFAHIIRHHFSNSLGMTCRMAQTQWVKII